MCICCCYYGDLICRISPFNGLLIFYHIRAKFWMAILSWLLVIVRCWSLRSIFIWRYALIGWNNCYMCYVWYPIVSWDTIQFGVSWETIHHANRCEWNVRLYWCSISLYHIWPHCKHSRCSNFWGSCILRTSCKGVSCHSTFKVYPSCILYRTKFGGRKVWPILLLNFICQTFYNSTT